MRVLLLGLIVVGCAHAACPTSAPPAPPVVIIVEPPPPAAVARPLLCDVGCAGTMNRVPPPHACDDCPPGYVRLPFRP